MASYQCTSAKWTVPLVSRTRAIAFAFTPATTSVNSPQPGYLADTGTGRKRLNIRNLAKNLELHEPSVLKCPKDSWNSDAWLAVHLRAPSPLPIILLTEVVADLHQHRDAFGIAGLGYRRLLGAGAELPAIAV